MRNGGLVTVTLRVKNIDTDRAYNLDSLGIDLVDMTDPNNPWTYGQRITGETIVFEGLKLNHKYQFVFRGEEGIGALLSPRPVDRTDRDAI